jgi:hypothetical protein
MDFIYDSAQKTQSAALLQFSTHCDVRKYVSFLENFAPCISGFLQCNHILFSYFGLLDEEVRRNACYKSID